MMKTVFEQMGGSYRKVGDYYLPNLRLPADIEEQAQAMFLRLVKQYADREGITEQLKTENPMEWVRKMNNIRACAAEMVNEEIILA